MRKSTSWILACIVAIFVIALTFFIVSLIYSQQHGLSIIEEWRSWFNIAEKTEEVVRVGFKAFLIR